MKEEKTRNTRNKRNSRKYSTKAFRDFRFFRVFRVFSSASIFVLILGTAASVFAQSSNFGDISIKIESITSGATGVGYDEYRATIINHSPNKSHRVTLTAPASPVRNSGARIDELNRTVEVAPASTAKVSLFLPELPLAGIDFAVVIDGQQQQDPVPIDSARSGAWVRRVNNKVYLLVSQSVGKSGLMNDSTLEKGLADASGNIDVAYLSYEFPLSEWSANWLGYSRFDGVVVSADDLQSMPEGVRSALLRYVECGGSMLVLGSWETPAQWQARPQLVLTIKSEDEDETETETETELKKKSLSSAAPIKNDLKTYYVGFGTLSMTGATDPQQIAVSQWNGLKFDWEGSRQDDRYYASISDINQRFSVIDRIGVPVRGLFILMILFVIVIGPINMIWLARRKKKIWLLWTIPAISLLTCLVISAFSLFGEGLSATSRTEAMTILDEVSRRATTIGWTAFYSPITPGEGLHFSYDTELQAQLPRRWEFGSGGGPARGVDWTSDQHLASEWITARVPAYFKFRKSETRRERLTVREEADGSVGIVNGLGAGIRQLWWADGKGDIYTATNIPAGAESKLTAINLKATVNAVRLRDVFLEDDWLGEFNTIEVNPRMSLRSNSYIAVLDASPFVEEGLRDVKTRKAKTLVYGIQR